MKSKSFYLFQKNDFLLELGKEYRVRCMHCGKISLVKREDIGIKYVCSECKKESRLIEMKYSNCFRDLNQRIGIKIG